MSPADREGILRVLHTLTVAVGYVRRYVHPGCPPCAPSDRSLRSFGEG